MWYFPVRYDSRVVNYDRIGFIRLATGLDQVAISYYKFGIMHSDWLKLFP